MRAAFLAAALLAVTALCGCRGGAENGQESGGTAQAEAAELLPLSIRTAAGVRNFRVEVARTEAEQARGLMYRTSLPDDGGMLFPSAQPEPKSFWMKNTVIPLDMIFIAADGTIRSIHANAVPHSTETIPSQFPVRAVLEINGGSAKLLGIKPGDKVLHSIFGNA